MKKTFTFLLSLGLLLLFNTNSKGQNLVPNPGFEIQDTCPRVSQIHLASSWSSATLGTPDLFNSSCSSQNNSARTGIGSSGVFTYSVFPNNREYIQAQLTAPLVAGQNYCVSFYVKRVDFRYATNHIGAYFSVGAVNQNTSSVLSFTPQVKNPSSNMLSSNSWINISGNFTATGGESHIIIGSFANDANTDTLVVSSTNSDMVAYYQIDDISVSACAVGIDDLSGASANIKIYPTLVMDILYLKNENNIKLSEYKIINLSGQVVKNDNIEDENCSLISVNVSSLRAGIYYISINSEYGIINKRFIVTN